MTDEKYRCLLISDFTIDNFASLLSRDKKPPAIETFGIPYGQVIPVLLDPNHECWNREYDFSVVWTRPQAVIESFNEVLDYKQVELERILHEVDIFLSVLSNVAGRVKSLLIPTWTVPLNNRGFGMLDMKLSTGLSKMLMQMNLKISNYFENVSNAFVLDANRWIGCVGPKSYNSKLWYMGKIPFANEVFLEAVKDIKAALDGIRGAAKKLVIVDLDETLWGGIVGDDGWENLRLGGHDAVGESFVDFQRALKALSNRGVLLGIVSKNEESTALEAIEKHPEMILRMDDFVGWRINWNDKAQNIVDLVEDLNLGLQSVVFLDDSGIERSRVREALSEVLVPELPEDKMLYTNTLLDLRCFDTPSISQEDMGRTEMYVADRKRKGLQKSLGTIDDWLKGLEIKAKVEPLDQSNLERTAQLLNKTNQMNLTTRRLTEGELGGWTASNGRWFRVFRVSDKLGDSGLTGVISLDVDGDKGRIVDFVLSCRVMGRRIEEAMLYCACKHARSLGLKEIYADYKMTKKNKPCFDFFKRSGFDYDEADNRFKWLLDKDYILHNSELVTLNDE